LCPTTAGSTPQICTPIDATECTLCATPCPGTATLCVVSGNTGTCVSGGFTDIQCANINDGAINPSLAPTTVLPSTNPVTSVDCYNYCESGVAGLTYFSLSRDIGSNGAGVLCTCYTGSITGTLNPAVSTCSCDSATANGGPCASHGGGTCGCTPGAGLICTVTGAACSDGYGVSTNGGNTGSIELYSTP
jgi:hypothetical protein